MFSVLECGEWGTFTETFPLQKVKTLYDYSKGIISGVKFESNAEELETNISIPVYNNDKGIEPPQVWCELETDRDLISTRYKKLYMCNKFEGVLVDS